MEGEISKGSTYLKTQRLHFQIVRRGLALPPLVDLVGDGYSDVKC